MLPPTISSLVEYLVAVLLLFQIDLLLTSRNMACLWALVSILTLAPCRIIAQSISDVPQCAVRASSNPLFLKSAKK